jgi:hypothetical protein
MGVFAGFGVDGLTISAGSSTVQGLEIVRFSGNGIDLNSVLPFLSARPVE